MPNGFSPVAELVVEASQVELGICEAGVEIDCLLVGCQGIAPATELLERGPEIKGGSGVRTSPANSQEVMLECFICAAGQLQQPTEIHVGIGKMRILSQYLGIRPKRPRRIADFELQRHIKQLPRGRDLVRWPVARCQR